MRRHRQRHPLLHVGQGRVHRHVGPVALRGRGHVNRRVRQRNARLGHPDKLHRLLRRHRHHQRLRIGHPHVLARADHDPPRDEPDILPGVKHLRQPVNRRVGVAPAHALDERADRVVMLVAVPVVYHRLALDALLGHRHVQVNAPRLVRRRRQHPDLQGVQALASIPVGRHRQVHQRVVVRLHIVIPQAAHRIGQRPAHQDHERLRLHRLQLKHLRARNQRAVDVEKRVVRRRADQPDHPALHIRQKHVLLRLVEAVDLVHEKDRPLARSPPPVRRGSHHPADIRHAAFHPAQALKFGLRGKGDHLGQARLAHPRRAVKQHG